MLIIAQGLKEKWFENDGFCSFKQQTNLWMKLPTIPPGLADKIVKYRPLSEPIRSLDLGDSARSQAWKKKRRKTWEGIYSLLNRKMNKNKTINTLKNFGSNTTTDNKSIISNVLNKHFKSIGTKLAAKLSNPEKNFTQFLY